MTSPFPYLTPSARVRATPYHDATLAAGVQGFTAYNHMQLPTFYESPEADYWALMNAVSMWDVAGERQVEITGPDAFELVTRMTPRNLTKTKIGQCKYAPLVDGDGGMVNDPVLLRLDLDHFWLSVADSDVLLWAKGLAHAWGLDLTVAEPDVSPLAIQGPKANDVAASLLGDWVRDLRFFRFEPFDLDSIPLIVARSGWSKQGGFELYLRDGTRGTELWERVAAAGAPFDIKPGAPSAMERIETGLLSYGNDMTLNDTPFHVGLGGYCDLDQPADFIGKAALRAVSESGVDRELTGLILDGEAMIGPNAWWPVTDPSDTRVGEIRSAAWSPRLDQMLAYAMISAPYLAPGTVLHAHTPSGMRTATVHPIPFI